MRWTRNARDNMLPTAPLLFRSIFAHGGKVGRRRRQVAINVGSLSTQGLFRPLPAIRLLIGKHLVHTWMGSSHEAEPCQRQQTLLPLSPTHPFSSYKPKTSREPQIKRKKKIPFSDTISHKLFSAQPVTSQSFNILAISISFRGLMFPRTFSSHMNIWIYKMKKRIKFKYEGTS